MESHIIIIYCIAVGTYLVGNYTPVRIRFIYIKQQKLSNFQNSVPIQMTLSFMLQSIENQKYLINHWANSNTSDHPYALLTPDRRE